MFTTTKDNNFYVKDTVPGVYISHYINIADWVIDYTNFSLDDYGITDLNSINIPEISIDPNCFLLSLINITKDMKSYVISIENDCYTENNEKFPQGINIDNQNIEKNVLLLSLH